MSSTTTTDGIHSFLKFLDHNRYAVIGILLAVLAAAALTGCAITTASTMTPGEKVTATELSREVAVAEAGFAGRQADLEAGAAVLNADIEAHNAAVDSARSDLQQKAEFRATVIETVGALGLAATQGTISPAAGVGAIVQLLTLGAAGGLLADNRRKDRMITENAAPAPPTVTS